MSTDEATILPEAASGGWSLMVIDDDLGDRKMMRRLLAGLAGKVVEVASPDQLPGREAGDVDAIFLDYLLPAVNGLDLMKTLRQRWPLAAIFMMTGRGDEEVAKSAILAGATDYVAKASISEPGLRRMLTNGIDSARMRWRIEEQRRELATFSDVLVHDLRAPIRAVRYLAGVAMEEIDTDRDALARTLGMLNRSVDQMADLVESLAAYTRFDREQLVSVVTVEDLVDRVRAALERDIAEAGATIEVEGQCPAIPCLSAQVAQLLQNLVANAIKFTGPGALVLIRATAMDSATLVEVRDNGPGVPEGFRERIFEPFTRATGVEALPGSGLGLATCRKIVSRHNGRIWCEAAPGPGTGTSIFFTLRAPRTG